MASEIDDKYVDVDFTKEPEFVPGDLPSPLFGFSDYAQVVREMSDREIRAAVEQMNAEDTGGEWNVTRIMDQKREGSCVGNALAAGGEALQCEMYGPDKVTPLSAISIYKRIGRSPSSGATISDGGRAFAEGGILPLDTAENRQRFGDAVMPHTGFHTRFPRDWEDTAAHFILAEHHIARSLNGIWTALCNRHPVVVGREGHAILYVGVRVDSRGRLQAVYANSWSLRWGFALARHSGGFGADTESQVKKSARYAVVLRQLKVLPLSA